MTAPSEYPYNPDHAIGTCANCGKEMTYNVPRLGPDGGFIHKESGKYGCENKCVIFTNIQFNPNTK